jgi:nucleotide-binding universal stress UspA family protein
MPFLQHADEIHFLTVSRDAMPRQDDLLQRHLLRHGCRPANLIVDSDGDTPPGEIIRRHVDLAGADLVVLGLYGHSRIQELVLGGVSHDLLQTLPMPLLVSH